jgi:hypothetical protein
LFQKSDAQFGLRFLKEALPLISTYFSGESVELAGAAALVGEDSDDESSLFAEHIRLRHALACCSELFPIVQRIEGGMSSITATIRTETKGVIRGRLDIPRYVSRRASSLSWPRTYPILVTSETPCTPENGLVVRILRTLLQRLSTSNVPATSAESILVRRYKSWIVGRIRRYPWADVATASSLARLYLEASRRISRRQTGNERAYSELVQFARDWRLVGEELAGSTASDRFAESLLSFPADEAFLDRIYEIWCVRSIAAALMQIGAELISGPVPMTESRRQPIYTLQLNGNNFEIWFQRSLPSETAEWRYESTGASLRGIPDICVVANDTHRILIDAKNRLVTGATRSEETYKMLGYFENFQSLLGGHTNWGALAFVSTSGFSRRLKSKNGRRLELISAHPIRQEDCTFVNDIKPIVEEWIAAIGVTTRRDTTPAD